METKEQAMPRYAAFISYSHADENEAARLHRALEAYRAPAGLAEGGAARLAPVFRDRDELSSAADLSASIREALAASGALIVICSPRAVASRWVNEEIRLFKRLHGPDRVFAVIVEGEPAEAFPEALLERTGPDGAVIDRLGEPLAADFRVGKDGRKLGFLKVAAGLLGVGLDALRQREQMRERRRLLAISGFSLAGMAVAVALAGAALVARAEAERQRARAEREAATATRTAEFMVDLFEVADPGEARGREVTAKEILDRGVASIDAELADEPAVQSALMHTMGRVYTGLGLYGDAAGLLQKARAGKAEGDPLALFETDVALAMALYEKGDFDAAREIYVRLLTEREDLAAAHGWRPVFAEALRGMGDVLYRKDEFVEAEKFYQRAVDELKSQPGAPPEALARAEQGLAGALYLQDRFDEARLWFEEAKAIFEREKGPDYYMIGAIENDLASSFYFEGELDQSIAHYRRALDITIKALGMDHPETAGSLNNLGRVELEFGKLDDANAHLSTAIKIQRERGQDKHIDFAFYLNSMGKLQAERGRFNEATETLNEALLLVPNNEHRLYGPILINLGRALCGNGDHENGASLVTRGRDALVAHYDPEHWRFGAADEFEAGCIRDLDEQAAAKLAKSGHEKLSNALGAEHYFARRAQKFAQSF